MMLTCMRMMDDLIETLWNVKENSPLIPDTRFPRFNRNIVECKGTACLIIPKAVCDLIETLWNVKD